LFDFWQILFNFLWIFGLSLLLAVWSISYYEAMSINMPVPERMRTASHDLAITIGLLLICAGLTGSDSRWWARLIWIIVGFTVFITWRNGQRKTSQE
jgi:hypothetical protein